jgi:hypothetical protein
MSHNVKVWRRSCPPNKATRSVAAGRNVGTRKYHKARQAGDWCFSCPSRRKAASAKRMLNEGCDSKTYLLLTFIRNYIIIKQSTEDKQKIGVNMDFLKQLLPDAAWLFLIIYIIIELAKKVPLFISIIQLFKQFKKIIAEKVPLFYAYYRHKYDKILINQGYIEWQQSIIENIYKPLIDEKRKEGYLIDITELNFNQNGKKKYYCRYESIHIKSEKIEYPFENLYKGTSKNHIIFPLLYEFQFSS